MRMLKSSAKMEFNSRLDEKVDGYRKNIKQNTVKTQNEMPLKRKTAIGDTAISILWCAFVMKTKISDFLVTL